MKKLMIGFIIIIIASAGHAFATTECDTNLDTLESVSSSLGGSKALLSVQNANSQKFQTYKDTLDKYAHVEEIGSYNRESLDQAIADNADSINNLKNNITRTERLSGEIRQMVKESCRY